MDKELTIIAEPGELIAWADTFDILLNPSIEDAAILLNYMASFSAFQSGKALHNIFSASLTSSPCGIF